MAGVKHLARGLGDGDKAPVRSDLRLVGSDSILKLVEFLKAGDEKSVPLILCPAPVIGVATTEWVQDQFARLGRTVKEFVDSENWLSNPESYTSLLGALHHAVSKKVIILGGDVHMSYVKDSVVETKEISRRLIQVVTSACKNRQPTAVVTYVKLRSEAAIQSNTRTWWHPEETIIYMTDSKTPAETLAKMKENLGEPLFRETTHSTPLIAKGRGKVEAPVLFDHSAVLLEIGGTEGTGKIHLLKSNGTVDVKFSL
jgi:hypothetical protein